MDKEKILFNINYYKLWFWRISIPTLVLLEIKGSNPAPFPSMVVIFQ